MSTLIFLFFLITGKDPDYWADNVEIDETEYDKYPDLADKSKSDRMLIARSRHDDEVRKSQFKRVLLLSGLVLLINIELFLYTYEFYPIVLLLTFGYVVFSFVKFIIPKDYGKMA